MVGDRMDTDIIAGTEAGMRTILVLSGVSTRETIETYPYRPTHVFEDVGHIPVGDAGVNLNPSPSCARPPGTVARGPRTRASASTRARGQDERPGGERRCWNVLWTGA